MTNPLTSTSSNGKSAITKEQLIVGMEQLAPSDPLIADLLRQLRRAELAGQPADTEQSADAWQAYTLADAYQERPPREYMAGKLFKLPSVNIVYGPPGSMKSLILQDMAVCVAAGIPWLPSAPWLKGGTGILTKQMPVMWIDFDNGSDTTHERFSALAHARHLPADIPLTYYSMPTPWLFATDKDTVRDLINRIKQRGIGAVYIDNLGLVTGDADENSAEMGPVMSKFRQAAEETGAVQTLIHHQRKSNGMTGRAGDTLRGHSSIEAAIDLALLIEREDYSETLTAKGTKVRGSWPAPFSATFTYEHRPGTDELLTARFFGIENEDDQSEQAISKAILTTLEGVNWPNQKALVTMVKEANPSFSDKRIRGQINRLAGEHKIQTKDGKVTNEILYSR